jgi:ribosome-associated heat shock protein Hsp15
LETEDRDWQRLDKWLWCARIAKTRAACARLVETGRVRVNRLPTDKPHFKLRPGDVLTLALGGADRGVVRIWRILALGDRRGPASEARSLYEDIAADTGA